MCNPGTIVGVPAQLAGLKRHWCILSLRRRRLRQGSRQWGSARYWYFEVEQHMDGPGVTAQ
jgi:hypothetical protein